MQQCKKNKCNGSHLAKNWIENIYAFRSTSYMRIYLVSKCKTWILILKYILNRSLKSPLKTFKWRLHLQSKCALIGYRKGFISYLQMHFEYLFKKSISTSLIASLFLSHSFNLTVQGFNAYFEMPFKNASQIHFSCILFW